MTAPSPYVITYFTEDLAANRKFYGETVGLPLHSDLPDVYFLCGTGGWRLQLLRVDDRPGRGEVSSGMVLFGFETEAALAGFHARMQAAGLIDEDGYRDPDGRIVMAQVFDRQAPFHD